MGRTLASTAGRYGTHGVVKLHHALGGDDHDFLRLRLRAVRECGQRPTTANGPGAVPDPDSPE